MRGKIDFLYVGIWFDVTKCKSMAVFSPIFVTETKLTFVYNFVTPLNVYLIFLNLLTSAIPEFPTSNFIFVMTLCNILSLQKKIEPHVFFLSILQLIWQDLAIECKSFNRRKCSI